MLVTLILIITSYTYAGQIDSVYAAKHIEDANRHYRARTYDSAYWYYNQAVNAFAALDLTDNVAETYLKLGNTLYRQRKYKEAEEAFLQSEELYLDLYSPDEFKLHRVYVGLAVICQIQGRTMEQRQYVEDAHRLTVAHYGEDHLRTAISYGRLGLVAYEFGDYKRALVHYHKALPRYLLESPEGHSRISGLLINMGITYSKLDDSEHAIEYIKRAIEVDRKLGGDENYILAYNYLNLAQLYKKTGRDSLAQRFLDLGIPLAVNNDLHQVHATSLYELGQLADRRGDDQMANTLYLQAVKVMEEGLGTSHQGIGFFLESLSDLNLRRGDFGAAKRYAARNMTILVGTYGVRHPRIGEAYAQQARVALAQGQHDLALVLIDSGIVAQSPSVLKDAEDDENFVTLSPATLLRLLDLKSTVLRDAGEQYGNLDYLRQALNLYYEQSKVMDDMRRSFMNEESKLFLQDESVKIFDRAIQLSHGLYVETDNSKFLSDAFTFCERNKSVMLGEALHAKEVKEVNGVPAIMIEREALLQSELDQARTSLITGSDSIVEAKYSALRQDYDSLIVAFRDGYPYYFEAKYSQPNIELDQIKASLKDKEAFVSYFRGDSVWTVFGVTNQGVHLEQIDRGQLDTLLLHYRNMVTRNDQPYDQQLAFSIYQSIIPEQIRADSNLNRLIVVSDGVIGHIPFEALALLPSGTPRDNYLINRFEFMYASSAALYFREGSHSGKSDIPYIGFAPQYAPSDAEENREGLGELPFAKQEVSAGQDILGGMTYVDGDASKLTFMKMDRKPAVLHLAMHTLIDDEKPEQSRLLFTSPEDSLSDGDLYAYEIYASKFRSQLLLLSACNTGYGQMHRGEGILSLARAFAFAGCENIIMSLWHATDLPTSQIIENFLENIEEKQPKATALRLAKLSYLKNADPLQAHPAHWAALALIGNRNDIVLGSSSTHWKWFAVGLIGLLIASTFYYRKKKSG